MLTAMDYVIAHITEEPAQENSDDGSYDIWLQAELHFFGEEYIIVAQPQGWLGEQCSVYWIDKDHAVHNLTPTGINLSGDSLPTLCSVAFNHAAIAEMRQEYTPRSYPEFMGNPPRITADMFDDEPDMFDDEPVPHMLSVDPYYSNM